MISTQPIVVEQGMHCALQPLIISTSDWSSPPRLSAAPYKPLELNLKLFSDIHGIFLYKSLRFMDVSLPRCFAQEVSPPAWTFHSWSVPPGHFSPGRFAPWMIVPYVWTFHPRCLNPVLVNCDKRTQLKFISLLNAWYHVVVFLCWTFLEKYCTTTELVILQHIN